MEFFRWTCWNLFLATVPILAALVLARSVESWRLRPSGPGALGLALLGLFWLAFLPNTCYLLTEWRHFLFDPPFTFARRVAWSDHEGKLRVLKHFAFFAGYSGFGVVSFALAIRPVDRVVRRFWPRLTLLAPPFYLAISLGVYLGLVVRLNSWDLATRPLHVVSIALEAVSDTTLLTLIAGFGGFLWMTYLVVDIWLDGLVMRLSQWKRGCVQGG